jgi:hypothetical protein
MTLHAHSPSAITSAAAREYRLGFPLCFPPLAALRFHCSPCSLVPLARLLSLGQQSPALVTHLLCTLVRVACVREGSRSICTVLQRAACQAQVCALGVCAYGCIHSLTVLGLCALCVCSMSRRIGVNPALPAEWFNAANLLQPKSVSSKRATLLLQRIPLRASRPRCFVRRTTTIRF